MAYKDKPAFRCKNCGHLEDIDHAGEHNVPHACSVCSEGIRFTAKGIKIHVPENWEILSELKEEELEKLGLSLDKIHKHISKNKEFVSGKNIKVEVLENLKSKDKN